ncbi:S8 family serine peptidase [Streptomyces daghestanicus]|uniref:Peptidase n=1 Tax=Streptomyces daghestanicus TaxID=66885 RepID=A0ABQ3QAT4_9ACTN|nr:S8 family serine peptidase [Streptomyces daghestanicus]GGU43627.1 peptidase [Streptomyces daghestanicus]GHI34397.1 peptidase [Streptomyces daghestanicus]
MSTRPRGTGPVLLAAAVAVALLPAGPAAAGAADAAPSDIRQTRADPARTVTLVTGDRVTVTGTGGGGRTVTVERPRGATGAVRTQDAGGSLTVVPDEALPYLRAGTLDERLFDVTELLRQGLGDGDSGELPLIVTYEKGASVVTPRSTQRTRTLTSVRGAAVEAARGRAFWEDFTRRAGTVEGVWLDGRVSAEMAESNAQIGTPRAWDAGLTGKGVTVAVLDSGVDAGHPDLAGRISAARSFVEGEEVADRHGHGTHVTSTVGGSGAVSDGAEKGVAPGATLAVGKVLSDQGSGSESQIIAGMEWAAREVKADVVSMSLGSTEASDGTDPMARAVNALSAETGALFVIAAGNTGSPSSIGSPGAADAALTVGAVDAADEAAWFTSAGPRHGDNALKPDLSAPGVGILAARSTLTAGEGAYTSMDGTSMATPHVAGVAALLAEEHPDWTGAQLKDALMSTSKPLDASAYRLGAGRVSVPDAIGADITATGSAGLGFHSWPYEENEPVTRTVTYTNSSAAPVELALSVEGAPEGVVTLADTALTVPAHGTAATTVTGDGTGAPVGQTSGRIVASAAGTPVARTAFGLVKEEERYTLTVHVKDRSGAGTAADLTVQRLAPGVDPEPAYVGDSGTLALRVKPGTYSLSAFLDVRGGHGADSLGLGFLAAPEVVVDRDREITLDGRTLREIDADVGRRTETRQLLMEYDRDGGGADLFGAVQVPLTYDSVFAAPTGRKVTVGTFEYRTVWRLGKPLLEVRGVGDATVQSGGTLPAGRVRLPLVDAGTGPVTGAKGKAVLARLTEGTDPAALARAAQDAGAKALFVTDDAPGRLMEWWGTDDNADRPLAVATLNQADAAALRRAGRVDMTGTPDTPYTYDLSQGHPGAIPDRDLTYRPGTRELATLHTKYHGARASAGGGFRYSLTGTFAIGIGFKERIAFPAERTEYVSTGPGQLWTESIDSAGGLEQRSGEVRYEGGTSQELDWFKPVWHPYLGTGLGWGQQRTGDQMRFNAPGWGDSGPDHTGFGDIWSDSGMTQTTALYQDGALVDRMDGSTAYLWDAPADEHTYRLVTDTALDAERWGTGATGHSAWTFRSARTPEDRSTRLPLINLSYDLGTDLAGEVRAGHRLGIGLDAAYVAGAADTGRLGGGRLDVSYDGGETWRPVRLSGDGGASWRGTLTVPRDAAHLSLRASAEDDRGGSVTQELLRAVSVR